MAQIVYQILSGKPNFTVHLFPTGIAEDQVKTELGEYTFDNVPPGYYMVVITDANGCTGVMEVDTGVVVTYDASFINHTCKTAEPVTTTTTTQGVTTTSTTPPATTTTTTIPVTTTTTTDCNNVVTLYGQKVYETATQIAIVWYASLSKPCAENPSLHIPITVTNSDNSGTVDLDIMVYLNDLIGGVSITYDKKVGAYNALITNFDALPTCYSGVNNGSVPIPALGVTTTTSTTVPVTTTTTTRAATTTSTTTEHCTQVSLSSDNNLPATFTVVYCNHLTDLITVQPNLPQLHCVLQIYGNDSNSVIDYLNSCVATTTTTIPHTTTTTTTFEGTTTTTTTDPNVTTTTTIVLELPTVVTTVPSWISQNSARSGGTITTNGSYPIETRGVCWSAKSTTAIPTVYNSTKASVLITNPYIIDFFGLWPVTVYCVRAYIITTDGHIIYGQVEEFTTQVADPPITTTTTSTTLPPTTTTTTTVPFGTLGNIVLNKIDQISYNTARGKSTLVSAGSLPTYQRGLVWVKWLGIPYIVPTPTLADNFSLDGTAGGVKLTGMANLEAASQYEVRAYVTNSAGTFYSNQLSFQTLLPTIFVPEAFSPNGDGIHDLFQVYALEYYPNNEMTIFDQDGSTIYHSTAYHLLANMWNGKRGNTGAMVAQGTYYYVLKVNGKTYKKSYVFVSY